MPPTYQLVAADTTARYQAARALIEEYSLQIGASMGVDLCFQNLSAELDQLPVMYGPPSGFMLLAGRDEEWVGCCALRRFADRVCEMKRLYVKSSARRPTRASADGAHRHSGTQSWLQADGFGHARGYDLCPKAVWFAGISGNNSLLL
jgi:hypothetical protein